MKQLLQLRIAEPCTARWETMRPEDRGCFCAACQKTVVDLTGLSDKELLAHLAHAGQGVCGRLSMEQVGRGMALDDKGRSRWRRFWQWLVAGLLITSEARGQQQVKAEVVQTVSEGRPVIAPSAPVRAKPLELTDSVKVKVLQEAVVIGYGHIVGRLTMGCISMIRPTSIIKDTLTALGFITKELTIYPNPVRRGNTAMLNWQGMENGAYEVTLISSAGALIQRRVLEVKGKEQIDLLEIPASLPEGMYFLRIANAGTVRVLTRKLVVL